MHAAALIVVLLWQSPKQPMKIFQEDHFFGGSSVGPSAGGTVGAGMSFGLGERIMGGIDLSHTYLGHYGFGVGRAHQDNNREYPVSESNVNEFAFTVTADFLRKSERRRFSPFVGFGVGRIYSHFVTPALIVPGPLGFVPTPGATRVYDTWFRTFKFSLGLRVPIHRVLGLRPEIRIVQSQITDGNRASLPCTCRSSRSYQAQRLIQVGMSFYGLTEYKRSKLKGP